MSAKMRILVSWPATAAARLEHAVGCDGCGGVGSGVGDGVGDDRPLALAARHYHHTSTWDRAGGWGATGHSTDVQFMHLHVANVLPSLS